MGTITENDFKSFANAVSDDLIQHKIPLNDSIRKLANARDLSQDQVSRLCEHANNVTFNKLFQARDKTAEDRIIEFDVADSKKILGSAVKEAATILATYDDENDDDDPIILSDFRSLREPEVEEHQVAKLAGIAAGDFKIRPEYAINQLKKAFDYLKHEKLATDMLYADALVNVRNQFKRLYNDTPFETFEKNAVALHAQRALKPLEDLRAYLRLPAVEYDFSVLQKTAGYIDDSPIVYKLFNNAVEHAERIDIITRGMAKVEGLINESI